MGHPEAKGGSSGKGLPSQSRVTAHCMLRSSLGCRGQDWSAASGPAGGGPPVHGRAEAGAQRLSMSASGGCGRWSRGKGVGCTCTKGLRAFGVD